MRLGHCERRGREVYGRCVWISFRDVRLSCVPWTVDVSVDESMNLDSSKYHMTLFLPPRSLQTVPEAEMVSGSCKFLSIHYHHRALGFT